MPKSIKCPKCGMCSNFIFVSSGYGYAYVCSCPISCGRMTPATHDGEVIKEVAE